LLDSARSPVLPADASHTYGNKFDLAERCVTTMAASHITLLEAGAPLQPHMPKLLKWIAEGKCVTLRFDIESKCVFVRTSTRKEESESVVKESSSSLFGSARTSTKVVRTVIEHFWRQSCDWKLSVYAGGNATAATLSY